MTFQVQAQGSLTFEFGGNKIYHRKSTYASLSPIPGELLDAPAIIIVTP
jgi:hypothetical protein